MINPETVLATRPSSDSREPSWPVESELKAWLPKPADTPQAAVFSDGLKVTDQNVPPPSAQNRDCHALACTAAPAGFAR